ncbi:MAG: YqaE/Pmp3 family membrane protein, partial [Akkermansia sp.]
MRYVLAILLPPSMALAYGGCGSFTLNIILCLVGYIPGMVHAILIVLQKESNDRHQAMMKE